jgi:hypothetical protein
MMEEKTIPFYNRREFRYLAIACMALIATAIGALFYNKHPKTVKNKNKTHIKNEALAPGNKAEIKKADSGNIQLQDSFQKQADSAASTKLK